MGKKNRHGADREDGPRLIDQDAARYIRGCAYRHMFRAYSHNSALSGSTSAGICRRAGASFSAVAGCGVTTPFLHARWHLPARVQVENAQPREDDYGDEDGCLGRRWAPA